jgi:hypothetical protein
LQALTIGHTQSTTNTVDPPHPETRQTQQHIKPKFMRPCQHMHSLELNRNTNRLPKAAEQRATWQQWRPAANGEVFMGSMEHHHGDNRRCRLLPDALAIPANPSTPNACTIHNRCGGGQCFARLVLSKTKSTHKRMKIILLCASPPQGRKSAPWRTPLVNTGPLLDKKGSQAEDSAALPHPSKRYMPPPAPTNRCDCQHRVAAHSCKRW